MDARVQTPEANDPIRDPALPGAHPRACRKPVGRPPRRNLDPEPEALLDSFYAFFKSLFPEWVSGINADIPDPRRSDFCKYSWAHLWTSVMMMFLLRFGSRNNFDQNRNCGKGPANMGELCGQVWDDPRFGSTGPTVSSSDNTVYHLGRVDPTYAAGIPMRMVRKLLERKMLDRFRLFDAWHILVVDGTVQEKCRKGFEKRGKRVRGEKGVLARYHYVLQVSILGTGGLCLPLIHEFMDMHDLVRDKEDCEIKAFERAAARLKKTFPRYSFCLVGDALYANQSTIRLCESYGWKYVFTLKEGRQPSVWENAVELLPLVRGRNKALVHETDAQERKTRRDILWVEDLALGADLRCHVMLEGSVSPEAATLNAWMTNFGNLTAERVLAICDATGRERHCIEDLFNAQKNNGAGLEHVFCANENATQNFYTMMMVAAILWQLFFLGHLKRLYEWARRTTQRGLAVMLGEALRFVRFTTSFVPVGQLRFVT